MQKRTSDTARECDRKVEGFREHIAIDGSLHNFRAEMQLVVGQWCSFTTTKKMNHDMKSMAQCSLNWKYRETFNTAEVCGFSPWRWQA